MPHSSSIRMKMQGGRPLPPSARRQPLSPSSWFSSPPPTPQTHYQGHGFDTFDFGFGPVEQPIFTGRDPLVAGLEAGDVGSTACQARKANHRKAAVVGADLYQVRQPSPLPEFPNQMYGGFHFDSKGRVAFEPGDRMDGWLAGLEESPPPVDADKRAPATAPAPSSGCPLPVVAEEIGSALNDSAAVGGNKRDAEDSSSSGQRPSKRKRISDTFHRTLSRMTDNSTTKFRRHSTAASSSGARNVFSRLSTFSWMPVCNSAQATKIKICLVGDSKSGKTALVNRLVSGEYIHPEPSTSTDYRSFSVIIDDGIVVVMELWDFPGGIIREKSEQLVSTFFQAAVICYSIEDEENVKAVSRSWKPKLANALIDCPLFVLGLKRDLRPMFPTLGLSFLSLKDPSTFELGRQVAKEVRAEGFAECSAKKNDNVQAVFHGIANYVVGRMKAKEKDMLQGHRRGKAKDAARGAAKDAGKAVVDALTGVPGVFASIRGGRDQASRQVS
ncbi:P-loop containing nucleoside triphosphate hydrolase protein [Podospora appendiculata]|uniref:P-loop containing nucleoside triphosphate hydrolase protein n=1 Tax=Podospora appendiculata TaxID=314037 RepID=A0AAE0X2U4_9PEZI|nr:P-loop containing nucleoside triphosphate hydrolase protein [Podospora appendiculata]